MRSASYTRISCLILVPVVLALLMPENARGGAWVTQESTEIQAILPGSGAVPGVQSAAQEPQRGGWVELGPMWPADVTAIGMAPDWSTSRTILAVSTSGIVFRTADGGVTWEQARLHAGIFRSATFTFAARSSEWSTVFVQAELEQAQGQPCCTKRLFRSTDRGASWLTVALDNPRILVPSPNFIHDASLFASEDGTLRVSRDGGTSWRSLPSLEGQGVRDIAISPNFAVDGTAWVAIGPGDPQIEDEPSGIFISRDRGESWLPAGNLEREGTNHTSVLRLAVSPAYATDGILFAVATPPEQLCPRPSSIMGTPERIASRGGWLFRSSDRSDSWEPIQMLGSGCMGRVEIALSQSFATDGIGFLTVPSSGGSPASSQCILSRLQDRGATLSHGGGVAARSYGGCTGLKIAPGPNGLAALVALGGSNGWPVLFSPDQGESWQALPNPPVPWSSNPPAQSFVFSPTFATDGWIFRVLTGSVWRYGPILATDPPRNCPLPVEGGFGRVWASNPRLHDILGCATEPERPMTFRIGTIDESASENTRIWPDAPEIRVYFHLYSRSVGTWSKPRDDRAGETWTYSEIPGAIQRFHRGWMIWLPGQGTPGRILVLYSIWEEFPDPGS
jgi:hypothetical protein